MERSYIRKRIIKWRGKAYRTLVPSFRARQLLLFLGFPTILLISLVIGLWFYLGPENRGPEDYISRRDFAELVLKIVGGAIVFYGAYFTWKRVEVLQEAQVTERFTRAIDQLGASYGDGREKLEVRLGGIYALERIAQDSLKDHWAIIEVLTAYVREHAPAKPRQGEEESAANEGKIKHLPHEIQAILTVLGRRKFTYGNGEDKPMDLSNTDLEGADLRGAHLEGADLWRCNLKRAHLEGAHLKDANLMQADLKGAVLEISSLKRANLWRARLVDVDFADARLERAFLGSADLTGAKKLTRAQIESAIINERTVLPDYLLESENKTEPSA